MNGRNIVLVMVAYIAGLVVERFPHYGGHLAFISASIGGMLLSAIGWRLFHAARYRQYRVRDMEAEIERLTMRLLKSERKARR